MQPITSDFAPNPPASQDALPRLIEATSTDPLPTDYLEFLGRANGGEGFLGKHYASLWRAEELVVFNLEYEVKELAPQLFLIGSNGGGEAYAFDRSISSPTVFRVPFIGMAYQEIQAVAASFGSFVGQSK
jgi:hypothetical protein